MPDYVRQSKKKEAPGPGKDRGLTGRDDTSEALTTEFEAITGNHHRQAFFQVFSSLGSKSIRLFRL